MGAYIRGGGPPNQSYVTQQTREKILETKAKEDMESKSYEEMVEEATATLADNHTWTNIKPE